MKEIPDRATHFKETRNKRNYESAEDYTELVAELIETKGEARTCDIAKQMGISHVTALRTIKRLARDGYLITQSHQPILLTEKGRKMAEFAKQRHQILLDFFRFLEVPEDVIATDVEGVEHHISHATLQAIQKHLKKYR